MVVVLLRSSSSAVYLLQLLSLPIRWRLRCSSAVVSSPAEFAAMLAIADDAAAGSAVLALLSCCIAAACSLAGQG